MDHQQYRVWVRRSGIMTIAFALSIVAIKLYAAVETNAASMLASLMDAMVDVAVSLLNFIALRYALKPADDDHRFGHGKAEAVMALFQAAFLSGAAFVLLYQGFNRFFVPAPIGGISTGIWSMVICSAMTLTLVLLQRWIIQKTGSLAVRADQAHYRSDLLMNAAVLLALYLVQNSLLWADAVIAILIAGYLLFNAAALLRESLVHLLDQELPEIDRQQIQQHLLKMPGVLGVDQLRTRRAGPRIFVQLRLLLPHDWSLQKAHQVTDIAEQEIAALYPDAEVIIHPDPRPHVAVTTD